MKGPDNGSRALLERNACVRTVPSVCMGSPPSLLAYFDASVLYGPDNGTPTSGAIGFLVEDGTTTHVEVSRSVDAFVSSAALEFRALRETVKAVDEQFTHVSSLHLHGDADAVIRAANPRHPAEPSDPIIRRRVDDVRARVADIPVVTYQCLPRGRNDRAHALARAGHE